ncbi:HAMP domain-containing sensor histidine kinase [Salinisphaera sp. T31B1]|uniref:sensor histidine kinase n=1 Tax=Salinisphaera sp. T31B1 TaxID=727963 RepID=UPI0033412A25
MNWPRLTGRLGFGLKARLRWLRVRVIAAMEQSAAYSRPNMQLFALVAVIAHPVYYLCWTELSPQPFESVWLRAFSIVIALPMLFEPYVSNAGLWRGRITLYWFLIVVYQLPFFFVFMSLMNGFSTVWALSTMAACLFTVLLVFDWLMVFGVAIAGAAAAAGCFWAIGGSFADQADELIALAPIYLFALIGGSIFNYKAEIVAREKLGAITSAVGTIAHELRTPLLSIRSGARGLQTYLPALFEGYELARDKGLPVPPVRTAHLRQMHSVLERINGETEYTNVILDMLLINASRTTIDTSTFDVVRIGACVEGALARYPFHSDRERTLVSWEKGTDFAFHGSQLLMIHLLFNLLKNALYFLAQADRGDIRIWTERSPAGAHRLHFRDTGPGIDPDVLPRIFERFYSAMPRGQGTGIGLAFARLVMESFGGDIRCHSALGRYTEFVLSFPALENHEHG